MTRQVVNIALPEDIYQRLQDAATLTQRPLEDVIFQTIRGNLPPVLADLAPEHRGLVADLQRLGTMFCGLSARSHCMPPNGAAISTSYTRVSKAG